MEEDIRERSFDFQYTGSVNTENEVISNGFIQLSKENLLSRISEKIIFGDYPMGFRFVTKIKGNGTVEGVNDVGSYDKGTWEVSEEGVFILQWENGWQNTMTRGYEIEDRIEFFDVETGNWRTTFRFFET